jgi:4-hydroxy-4-methyl-2-oxoglutarate aldolase
MTDILRSRAEAFSAATLTDAIGRICRHRAHILDLVSPTPGRKLFGRAVTIRYIPYRADIDNDGWSFARAFSEAIGEGAEGAVMVIDSAGEYDVSIGGGAKFSRLHNHGLAGLITDARIRDFNELAAFDPVFYCRGETVQAGTATLMPIAANVPVSLHGTTVLPDDYIYADASGVVIIPAGQVEQILTSAAEIDAQEKAFLLSVDPQDRRSFGHLRRGVKSKSDPKTIELPGSRAS